MKEHEIKTIVFGLLKNIAPDTEPEKLKPEDNIKETLNIDSFDFLKLIVGIDEKFGIATPEEDYGKIMKLGELVSYIVLKMKK